MLNEFQTLTLIYQSAETVEKQHLMLCYKGGLIFLLMHVALIGKYASRYIIIEPRKEIFNNLTYGQV